MRLHWPRPKPVLPPWDGPELTDEEVAAELDAYHLEKAAETLGHGGPHHIACAYLDQGYVANPDRSLCNCGAYETNPQSAHPYPDGLVR